MQNRVTVKNNALTHLRILGYPNLGSMFQIRYFYGTLKLHNLETLEFRAVEPESEPNGSVSWIFQEARAGAGTAIKEPFRLPEPYEGKFKFTSNILIKCSLWQKEGPTFAYISELWSKTFLSEAEIQPK